MGCKGGRKAGVGAHDIGRLFAAIGTRTNVLEQGGVGAGQMTAFFSRKLAVSSGFAQANVGVRLGPVSAVADSEAAAAPAAAATTAEAEGSPAERRTAGAAEPLATTTATGGGS